MKRLFIAGFIAIPSASAAQVTPDNVHEFQECVRLLADFSAQMNEAEGFWTEVAEGEMPDEVMSTASQLGMASLDALNALAEQCEAIRQE